MIRLQLPLEDREILKTLKVGDKVLLSGVIYTGRDAAHKRLTATMAEGAPLPVDIENIAIYYTGPCPKPENRPIGSCGPTTSGRMDAYAPMMIEHGQAIMIGKGERNQAVIDACREHGAVYLAASGGAGALLADTVKECTLVAYTELLSEAIHKLTVEDMPLTVAIDTFGNDLFKIGRDKYRVE